MDSWPYDDRRSSKQSSQNNGKSSNARSHPYLQQGMVGAVTLAEQHGRFEWSFLRSNLAAEPTQRWRFTEPFKVFPETRGPLPQKSQFSAKVSAQHGANFIRTCMPETDVPLELIREQLEEADTRLKQVDLFDPFAGNTLVSTLPQTTTDAGIGFLAFPMGDVMCDLNVSTVNASKETGVSIKPVGGYKRTFDTPIQQLVTEPLDQDHILGIRTYAAVDFLRLKRTGDQPTWAIESGPKLTIEDSNRREVVDVKLRSGNAVLVNEAGSIYSIRPFSHKPKVVHISDVSDDHEFKDPDFWRLAFDLEPDSGYVMSSDSVLTFDMRSSKSPQKSFELNKANDFLTSLESCGSDGIVRLCSTNEILWLDRRNLRSPLLSVRHYRQFDRYLSTTTVGNFCTFLTSRRNNMISVYDVSPSNDKLLHIKNEPFGILPRLACSESVGETFLASPFLPAGSHAIVLKLSERGAIFGCSLLPSSLETDLDVNVKYTSTLRSIDEQTWDVKEGLMLEQDRTQMNMSPAYEKIFKKHLEEVDKYEELEAEQVYDLVDQIPLYFHKSDAVIDQMLTTYDVAFRTGEEPKDPSRSDFLTGSVLNSQRGYRALRQERLDPRSLQPKAQWHLDLAPTLKQFGLEETFAEDQEPFAKYDLEDSDKRTAGSLRLEKRYREQLEVDLRLSRNVFSSQPFAKASEVDQTLETMTEALSLGDTPPEVEFGFLRPVFKKDEEEDTEGEQGRGLGMGVKLLLKDWEISSDLTNYTYHDPYNTVEARPQPRRHPAAPMTAPTAAMAPPQLLTQPTQTTQKSVRPPTLVPQLFSQPGLIPMVKKSSSSSESQRIVPANHTQSQTQTQDVLMASTQVLPGPFGGRPTKKKAEKKRRMGGF
ncbi:hypothetical protein D9611_004780 [Ephemerocybe angulata]|uniref:Uncharacterized protein n=1 Tax=Ephemerocybe angulata TaxID=980116 RepID=A0A8H5EWZ5_9AGAR|nr:hypothetical protein D9611_004780 [Tulosesus angulatus]